MVLAEVSWYDNRHGIFLVLAEEQSISRVAQHLFVTQQSMSEQMKRLEQLYCAKLFTRRPRFH